MMKPPGRVAERRRYERLMETMAAEFLPCSPAEMLVLEEVVILELRRMKLQEALAGQSDLSDSADLKRFTELTKCEADVCGKLDKRWKRLEELQEQRSLRRGLALEAALVRPQVEAATRRLQAGSLDVARRALQREMLDLGVSVEEARRVTGALLGTHCDTGGTGAGQSASNQALDALPPVPEILPGPPWNPWRDVSPEQLERWNDEMIEHEKTRLRQALARLEGQSGHEDAGADHGAEGGPCG